MQRKKETKSDVRKEIVRHSFRKRLKEMDPLSLLLLLWSDSLSFMPDPPHTGTRPTSPSHKTHITGPAAQPILPLISLIPPSHLPLECVMAGRF